MHNRRMFSNKFRSLQCCRIAISTKKYVAKTAYNDGQMLRHNTANFSRWASEEVNKRSKFIASVF